MLTIGIGWNNATRSWDIYFFYVNMVFQDKNKWKLYSDFCIFQELQKDKSMKLSPRQSNIQQNVDNETPSKFLGAGREYRPAFDLDVGIYIIGKPYKKQYRKFSTNIWG